ncbi:MAG: hypothetical protein DDT30_01124 [Dehalococcoidia bacterium]|nr:hypothetical protein [Bacillota bacterium]MBT9166230.1 hypothetical protein [Chloroflexota bacterium]
MLTEDISDGLKQWTFLMGLDNRREVLTTMNA